MTLRGLINAVFEASCLAWRWRRPVLAGAAIGSPSVRRRPTTVLSTASRARDSTSDALCRAQPLPRKLARFPLRARPAFPVVSSKPPVRSDQSAFHRRMLPVQAGSQATPGTGTRHRSHGFAAARRLPEPVRALVHPRFPRGGPEARPDASPRGPSSVRRLLQPKLTREHALRILRSLELVRPVTRALTLSGGVASLLAPGPKIRRESTRLQSRFLGPGTEDGFRLPSSSRRDCSRGELRPNPMVSDTPRRGIVRSAAGLADLIRRATRSRAGYESTRQARFRALDATPDSTRLRECRPNRSRAASRAPPRRGARSAAPEVPSVAVPPRSRCGVVHRL
jgi:hypothetical protein